MPTLTDKTVADLLDAFSAPDPTPGGGSAAALAGAIGASLLAMVAGLPKTKSGSTEDRKALDTARSELLKRRHELVDLVDRDAAAYDHVVAAYQRPKTTDEEKTVRKVGIQDAIRLATEVPIETMRACAEAAKAGLSVAEHGNPSAKSDVAVGLHLLGTASQGALLNVEVNIASLSDPVLVEALTLRVRSVVKDTGKDMRQIYQTSGIIDLMKQAALRAGLVTPDGRHVTPAE